MDQSKSAPKKESPAPVQPSSPTDSGAKPGSQAPVILLGSEWDPRSLLQKAFVFDIVFFMFNVFVNTNFETMDHRAILYNLPLWYCSFCAWAIYAVRNHTEIPSKGKSAMLQNTILFRCIMYALGGGQALSTVYFYIRRFWIPDSKEATYVTKGYAEDIKQTAISSIFLALAIVNLILGMYLLQAWSNICPREAEPSAVTEKAEEKKKIAAEMEKKLEEKDLMESNGTNENKLKAKQPKAKPHED